MISFDLKSIERSKNMLTESKRNSIGEVIDKLTRLDKVGMMIIMSNAMALLARQELDKDNASQDTTKQTDL